MRTIRLVLLACLVGVLSNTTHVHAAEGLDAQTRQLWERHWRVYAQKCAEFEGEYLCCPTYDRRYPSSAGMTVRQAEDELSERVLVGGGGIVKPKTIKMPKGEAQAMALTIPKLTVGQYGYLVSAEVDEVLGPTSMTIKSLYLIDGSRLRRDFAADRAKARQAEDPDLAEAQLEHMYAQRDALVERQKDRQHRRLTVRLEGYPTRGLTEGERWTGPGDEGIQLLIVRQEHFGSKRRPKQRLVAVAPEKVRWGLDEAGFVKLLEARELDPAGFVQVISDVMAEEDTDKAQGLIFTYLLPTLAEPDGDNEAAGDDASADIDGGGAD